VLRRIDALLAVRAAERGDAASAGLHAGRLGGEEAELRRAMAPLRARIDALIKGAREEAEANPKGAVAPTKRLLTEGKAALAAVDALLPPGHPLRTPHHDEIAQAALTCQVLYANATKDWKTSAGLLQSAEALAEGPDARAKLAENVRIVKENVEYGLCWYCRRESQVESSAVRVSMYGDVRREAVWNGTRVLWNKREVPVPRCRACQAAHATAGNVMGWGVFLGLGLGIWLGIKIGSFWAGAGIAVFLFTVFGVWSSSIPKRRGTRGLEVGNKDWPPIKELVAQGWQFGQGPQ
jgi:hypothetical protein